MLNKNDIDIEEILKQTEKLLNEGGIESDGLFKLLAIMTLNIEKSKFINAFYKEDEESVEISKEELNEYEVTRVNEIMQQDFKVAISESAMLLEFIRYIKGKIGE